MPGNAECLSTDLPYINCDPGRINVRHYRRGIGTQWWNVLVAVSLELDSGFIWRKKEVGVGLFPLSIPRFFLVLFRGYMV